ncbi:MAG: PaaI family thioesterase [Ilumatobacteraceae bacterium]
MVTEAGAWDGFHVPSVPLTPQQVERVDDVRRLREEAVRLLVEDPLEFAYRSPMVGTLNAVAAPMVANVVEEEGSLGTVVGHVTFSALYEGPPGCVHGGFIAAYFDDVLGMVQALSGKPGMTANLSVNYRSPTPLNRPLVFRARIVSVEGRKIHTAATLHHGETLCADATAVFVSMSAELIERLIKIRQASA